MTSIEVRLAQRLGRLRIEQPCCHFYDPLQHGAAGELRRALRQAGVPALELNDLPSGDAVAWVRAAEAFSVEFMMPVMIFGSNGALTLPVAGQEILDQGWLDARQIAMSPALDRSSLHQEYRRTREKAGWVRVGWQAPEALAMGNGLLLAWSSPLPLRRIRDFAARCPELTFYGEEARALAEEVAEQGISAARWRFEVK